MTTPLNSDWLTQNVDFNGDSYITPLEIKNQLSDSAEVKVAFDNYCNNVLKISESDTKLNESQLDGFADFLNTQALQHPGLQITSLKYKATFKINGDNDNKGTLEKTEEAPVAPPTGRATPATKAPSPPPTPATKDTFTVPLGAVRKDDIINGDKHFEVVPQGVDKKGNAKPPVATFQGVGDRSAKQVAQDHATTTSSDGRKLLFGTDNMTMDRDQREKAVRTYYDRKHLEAADKATESKKGEQTAAAVLDKPSENAPNKSARSEGPASGKEVSDDVKAGKAGKGTEEAKAPSEKGTTADRSPAPKSGGGFLGSIGRGLVNMLTAPVRWFIDGASIAAGIFSSGAGKTIRNWSDKLEWRPTAAKSAVPAHVAAPAPAPAAPPAPPAPAPTPPVPAAPPAPVPAPPPTAKSPADKPKTKAPADPALTAQSIAKKGAALLSDAYNKVKSWIPSSEKTKEVLKKTGEVLEKAKEPNLKKAINDEKNPEEKARLQKIYDTLYQNPKAKPLT